VDLLNQESLKFYLGECQQVRESPHAQERRGEVERGNEEFHPLWVGDELPNSY
jgi:hypothetical protein